MSDYQVIPATPVHAEAFCQLSRAVAYTPETADPNSGFLVFQGTPDQYAHRLAQAPDSLLAVSANGTPAAFLLAFREERVLFIDQIGVSPAARGAGLAQKMFDALIACGKPSAVAADIMHAPVRNQRSIRFFTGKNGFAFVHSFNESECEWGRYERKY